MQSIMQLLYSCYVLEHFRPGQHQVICCVGVWFCSLCCCGSVCLHCRQPVASLLRNLLPLVILISCPWAITWFTYFQNYWIYDNEIGHVHRLTWSFGELLTFRLAVIVRNFSYFPLTCAIWVKLEFIYKVVVCYAAWNSVWSSKPPVHALQLKLIRGRCFRKSASALPTAARPAPVSNATLPHYLLSLALSASPHLAMWPIPVPR